MKFVFNPFIYYIKHKNNIIKLNIILLKFNHLFDRLKHILYLLINYILLNQQKYNNFGENIYNNKNIKYYYYNIKILLKYKLFLENMYYYIIIKNTKTQF